MELFQASNQWMSRPDDQRFWDINEMVAKTKAYADASETQEADMKNISFRPDGTEVLINANGQDMRMTHHAFNQVCNGVGAPTSYLRGLVDHELVARCLNHGAGQHDDKERSLLIDHSTGRPLLRAQTSDRYSRLWNHEIATELATLGSYGWKVPPARPVWNQEGGRTRTASINDTIDFGVNSTLSVKPGDTITPSGLYASDHDMFAFMVNPELRVSDGSDGGLMRGFFLWNSEVGSKSIGATSFMLRSVCGNHIVWGAEEVFSMRMIHTGDVRQKLQALIGELGLRQQRAASVDEERIKKFQTTPIAESGEEVVNFIQEKRILTRRDAAKAFIVGEEWRDTDGDPTTFWGFANAITRYSQLGNGAKHTESRANLDTAAGNLLALCN